MEGFVLAETNQMCRTCMNYNREGEKCNLSKKTFQLHSIYDFVNGFRSHSIQIKELLNTTVPKLPKIEVVDALPKKICTECLDKLCACYDFQNLCINSDFQLRNTGNSGMLLDDNRKQNLSDPLQCAMETTVKQEIQVDVDFNNVLDDEEFIAIQKPEEVNKNSIENIEGNSQCEPSLNANDEDALKKDDEQIGLESLNELCCEDAERIEEQNVWSCEGCSLSFLHKNHLTLHLKANSCKRRVQGKKVKKVILQRFNCKYCDATFTAKRSLKRHTLNKHKTDAIDLTIELNNCDKNFEIWECKICLNVFYHKRNLARHMKIVHNEELPRDTQAVNGVENFKRLSEIFKCDECDKFFHKKHSLAAHKRHHLYPRASTTCQECNKTFTKLDKLRDHERVHRNEKPYLCSDCGKAFRGRAHFKQHRLRHSAERRYQCPQCPKKFFTQADRCGHVRQVHNTKKPFVCEVCAAAFKRPSGLKMHMSTHTGDRRFKCDFCDKRFWAKEHMHRHRRSHTGEKPYKCKYCVRCYKSASDLRKHLGTHLGEKSYLCELCPAAFRLARELQIHFASHRHDDEETKVRNKQAWLEAQRLLEIKIAKHEENQTLQ